MLLTSEKEKTFSLSWTFFCRSFFFFVWNFLKKLKMFPQTPFRVFFLLLLQEKNVEIKMDEVVDTDIETTRRQCNIDICFSKWILNAADSLESRKNIFMFIKIHLKQFEIPFFFWYLCTTVRLKKNSVAFRAYTIENHSGKYQVTVH